MTIIEKLKEWEREAEDTFNYCTPDFIAGVQQGFKDCIQLLTEENADKKI